MGHKPKDIAFFVADACDVAQGTVGIIYVTEHDAIFGFELIQSGVVGGVAALAMSNWELHDLALSSLIGEGRIDRFDAKGDGSADVLKVRIADQRARQESRLG